MSASSSLRKEYSSCSASSSRERGFEAASEAVSEGGAEEGVGAADWRKFCEFFSTVGTGEGGGVGVDQSQPISIQNLVVVR